MEAWISGVVGLPRMQRGEGFGSGVMLGGALGLAYFPCAGPILAGVITVSAAQDFTVGRLAVALAYGLGSGAVLYALVVGGCRLTDRLKPIRSRIQMAIGAVMVFVAVLMAADLDVRFQNEIADNLPGFLTNPTGGLEENEAIASGLSDVRGGPHGGAAEGGAEELAAGLDLPVIAPAPEFADTQQWFNTDGEELSISELTAEGKVVLIDFWTYTCINCIRTLPYLKAWDEEYRDDGLVIVGVHSPEFPFEREADNVADSIEQNGLRYPVVQDNELGTWNNFANQYWPAKYLIDSRGQIRFTHFGEGEYDRTEEAIRTLLAEAGDDRLGKLSSARGETADPTLATPETYLGAARAEGFVNGRFATGINDFGLAGNRVIDRLPANAFAFQGRWRHSLDDATAISNARLDGHFRAAEVFLVMGSPDRDREVEVLLDGKPIPDRLAGPDVEDGVARVGEERLYRLIDLGNASEHVFSLRFERGISGYAFTFG
jgi:thiol-disulfide isomerase/thioredoxin